MQLHILSSVVLVRNGNGYNTIFERHKSLVNTMNQPTYVDICFAIGILDSHWIAVVSHPNHTPITPSQFFLRAPRESQYVVVADHFVGPMYATRLLHQWEHI